MDTPLEQAKYHFLNRLRILKQVVEGAENNPDPFDLRFDEALDATQEALDRYRDAHNEDRRESLKVLPEAR